MQATIGRKSQIFRIHLMAVMRMTRQNFVTMFDVRKLEWSSYRGWRKKFNDIFAILLMSDGQADGV